MKVSLLIALCLLMAGCQSSGQASVSRSTSVMSMWDLYRHCQSSADVETVLTAAKQLQQQSAETHVEAAPEVPKTLDRFVTKQPVRTTVDPKALAASCTLQAARTSLSAGRGQEAEQLLHAVVSSYPESEYTFYVAQAKVWIEELHGQRGPDSVVHPIAAN
jgi:outer membrane protein assembly factor BamD (BamD/ComL family)